MAGKNRLPIFKGQIRQGRALLFWEHFGVQSLLAEKLVKPGGKSEWERYNLITDRTKLDNLAGKYPDKVTQRAPWWEERVIPAP